jgi:hypothetical protein
MEFIIFGMTDNFEKTKLFEQTLEKGGFKYDLIKAPFHWGQQQIHTLDWAKKNADKYSHFVYTDTWDVVVMGTWNELLLKVKALPNDFEFLGSCEKAYFPTNDNIKEQYPKGDSEWQYLNGGGWLCKTETFIKWQEELPSRGINDQEWLHMMFTRHQFEKVFRDTQCKIFQSIAFNDGSDFEYQQTRVFNQKTLTHPLLVHGNGRSDMSKENEVAERILKMI